MVVASFPGVHTKTAIKTIIKENNLKITQYQKDNKMQNNTKDAK